MRYTCTVCNREFVTRRNELSWSDLASGSVPVPWHVCIDGAYACADCIADADHPGKFEGHRHDRSELGKALILNACSLDGMIDDRMYQEGWGSCERIGRFLLMEDDRGFVTFDEFDTEALAEKRYSQLYLDGWGADEYDGYVSSDGWRGYSVSLDGKALDVWPNNFGEISERRAIARLRLEMMRTGYYPDCWLLSDHGNLTHLDI